MYRVWHVDKYKITFKLFINWANEILYHTAVSSGLSRHGIIDARARYRAVARPLRNTAINDATQEPVCITLTDILKIPNSQYEYCNKRITIHAP